MTGSCLAVASAPAAACRAGKSSRRLCRTRDVLKTRAACRARPWVERHQLPLLLAHSAMRACNPSVSSSGARNGSSCVQVVPDASLGPRCERVLACQVRCVRPLLILVAGDVLRATALDVEGQVAVSEVDDHVVVRSERAAEHEPRELVFDFTLDRAPQRPRAELGIEPDLG